MYQPLGPQVADRGPKTPVFLTIFAGIWLAMGTGIDFETGAVAQLQRRVAQADNRDLLAFARGHSAMTAAIHDAVLTAISAESEAMDTQQGAEFLRFPGEPGR